MRYLLEIILQIIIMRVVFGMYFGWLTAASIVCTSQALSKWGFNNNSGINFSKIFRKYGMD